MLKVDEITKDFYPPISFSQLFKLNYKKNRPTRALEGVTFSLSRGNILGVLGPNGSGKTTLLKIISSLILPDRGIVEVNGLQADKHEEKIKSFIGLAISAERGFYLRLTGRQNLEFFAAMYGFSRQKTNSRLKELFDLFQVSYQDKRFDSYSTGMKQKFSLIRSLLHNPELLLLDEPTKSLDYTSSLALRQFIKDTLVSKMGKTVIFSSHNMNEAEEFADVILILHKGRIIAFGSLKQLREKIGNPSANLSQIFTELTRL